MKKPVEDWVSFADSDLKTAEIVIRDGSPLANIIAFHCQQAIEKYFKAYLLEKNIPIIKTHDLIKLNNMIKEVKDLNINENMLIMINEVYSETRYPGDMGLILDGLANNKQDEKFIEYAKEIRSIIYNELI